MNKNTYKSVKLAKGEVKVYDFGRARLHAYQTHDLIDDEVFVIEKNGRGAVIELPCFYDNISELTDYLKGENIAVEAKLVAYHGAGATFLPEVPAYGTESSVAYNTNGGGARNTDYQLVDWNDQPVARLYGAGEFGSIFYHYYSGGGNICECFTSGMKCGQNVSALEPWA